MNRLKKVERTKMMKALYPLTIIFYDAIPINKVSDILQENGYLLLQEDNMEWSGFLCGRDSHTIFAIGRLEDKDDRDMYKPIETGLYFSWYKHTTGRYEINLYFT